MSPSSPSRGQTEPLGALVAVLMLLVGVTLYATAITEVLPGQSDRTPESAAIDRIWADLEDGERGVFPAYEYETDTDAAMRNAIDRASLPHGSNIYVEIRAYDEGEPTVFAAAHFDSHGETLRERQLPSSDPDFGPPRDPGEPDGTGVATRSIPVEVTPADVRGGTLIVEAW